jgi:Concanavalin A-like lectin/glucanases superfamily
MKFSIFKTFFSALILPLTLVAQVNCVFAQNASILPLAKTQFLDQNGKPLTKGSVFFYIPGTTTPLTTYQDSAGTIPNTNPVILDAGGRALILGNGFYRQVVEDSNNNLIWDQVTSSPGASNASTTVGDGNNVGTILPWPGFIPPLGYAFAYGQVLNRVTFAPLLSVLTQTEPVTCTGGSPVLTNVADTSQLPIGAPVEVPCLTGAIILSTTANTVTVSINASVSLTLSAQFFPFGNGDGITTFNIPDLRGKTLVARNNMGGSASNNLITSFCQTASNLNANPNAIGTNCGGQGQTLAITNLPPYTPTVATATITNGTITAGAITITGGVQGGVSSVSNFNTGGAQNAPVNASAIIATSANPTQAPSSASIVMNAQGGTSSPFSLMQPSFTENYIIKTTANQTATSTTVVLSLGGQQGNITCGANITCTGNSIAFSGGSMAQQNSNAVAITGGTITGMPTPVNPTDVAIKSYADNIAAGIIALPSSNLATVGALPNTPTYNNGTAGVGATLTAASNATLTVDSILTAVNNVILVQNQASSFQNGIYLVTQAGSGSVPWILTRATYFNASTNIKAGSRTFITGGATLIGNAYTLLASAVNIGTDAINFGLYSQPVNNVNVLARQSILSASVNSIGFPNFASAGAGLNVNLTATATPLYLAYAAGFSSAGVIDFVGQETSDIANFWSSLTPVQYYFLAIDRNVLTGALTPTQTLMRPQKGQVFYAPRQALLHFDASNNTDDWGNAWVAFGATYTAGCAMFGAEGVSLNGSSSYVQSASIINPGQGNWTMDVWAKFASVANQSIFSVGNAFGAYVTTNGSGNLTLFLSSNGVFWDIANSAAGATALTANVFHHVELTFDGSNYRVFLDGILQITVAQTTTIWANGVAMAIGEQVGSGASATGCFDEFDFVPFARNVVAFTPPSAPYAVAGDWFDTNQMLMKTATAAGPTWSTIQRQYVAEAQTGASSVSAVYDYSPAVQYKGGGFAYNNGANGGQIGNTFYYAATPQFITNWSVVGSPVTWVMSPSQVPPNATAFYVQLNDPHAPISNTGGTPYSDCTFTSSLPILPSQNYATLAAEYIQLPGLGTINQNASLLEQPGGVIKYPVINGIASFITTIGGGTCSAGNATFTGTASGTNLTASAVTGTIAFTFINGNTLITGNGVPINTFITSQTSGTPGGAGVYVTSNPTTASGSALTSAGNGARINTGILIGYDLP